jgi:hypothetical protein
VKRLTIRALIWAIKRLLPKDTDVILEWRNKYPKTAARIRVQDWSLSEPGSAPDTKWGLELGSESDEVEGVDCG